MPANPLSPRLLRRLLGASALTLLGVGTAQANHDYLSCALFDDGQVKCWGYNGNGNLGLGDTANRGDNAGEMGNSLPYLDLGEPAVEVQTTYQHACATLQSGGVKCWGYNGNGNLGLGDTLNRGDNPGEMGNSLPYLNLGNGLSVEQIDLGTHHTCAVLSDGGLKCWGYNAHGTLGQGHTSNIGDQAGETADNIPYVDLGTGRTAKSVAAGYLNTCAVLDNDKVKCWGYNPHGQLGHGHTTQIGDNPNEMGDNLPYTDLGTGRTVKYMDGSIYTWCAILDNDRLKCWGHGGYGEIGHGAGHNLGDNAGEMGDNLPYVDLGTDGQGNPLTVKNLWTGAYHMCAQLENDGVKCWGRSHLGALGRPIGNTYIGDAANEMGDSLPYMDFGTDGQGNPLTAVDVTLGHYFGCALLNDGGTKCWGYEAYGQPGHGDGVRRGDGANEMGNNLPYTDLGDGTVLALSDPTSNFLRDLDGDGIPDDVDNCAAGEDDDADNICNDVDNCPSVANADQTDDNGDGWGDACVSTAASIHPRADITPGAVIGANADIGPYTVVGAGASVDGSLDDGAQVGAGSSIGTGCSVGAQARIGESVGFGANCNIGSRVIVNGSVSAGDNVTLSSRATVGAGSTLGNGVSIGTDASIGDGSDLAAGTSVGDNSHISGAATLGTGSSVAANSVINGALNAGENVTVGSNCRLSGVTLANGASLGSYTTAGANLIVGANSHVASGVTMGDSALLGEGVEVRGDLGDNVGVDDDAFIGNQSSIGSNSNVHGGVTVGQFVTVGAGSTLRVDAAIFSGVTLGDDADIGARAQVLYRTTMGANATVGPDAIIDEQITAGDDLTVGTNSRLWPFSTFGHRVSIGDNVLVRNNSDLEDDVTVEDGAILYTRTTVREGATIRANVEIGVADCRAGDCGNVTIGACNDVSADMAPSTSTEGGCADGSAPEQPGVDCQSLLAEGHTNDGVYWIDPDGEGGVDAFQVFCDQTTEGGGWIDLVATFDNIGFANDTFDHFFISAEPGQYSVTPSVAQGLSSGTTGLQLLLSGARSAVGSHNESVHLVPNVYSFTQARVDYRIQGESANSRCGSSSWIPLSGPGYNGGTNYSIIPCPNGISCIGGSTTNGRDASIAATYSSNAINATTYLTFRSTLYDQTNGFTSACSRDNDIPLSGAVVFFYEARVR